MEKLSLFPPPDWREEEKTMARTAFAVLACVAGAAAIVIAAVVGWFLGWLR